MLALPSARRLVVGSLYGTVTAAGSRACLYISSAPRPLGKHRVYWGKERRGSLGLSPSNLFARGRSFAPSAPGVPELSPEEGLSMLTKDIDTVILDCDGVLWRGAEVIPGTQEALEKLRKLDKRVLFLTNNASKSRKAYQQKFASLGIQCSSEEIVPASYCAVAYLKSIGFPKEKKVFLIGNRGVEEELEAEGISFIGGESDIAPSATTTDELLDIQVDPSIGAVVVGFDWNFSYDKLTYASICLREIPGCHFVLTNGDHGDNIGNGRMMPGTGSICAAVELASGRKPVIVGKGGSWLLPWICEEYKLTDPSRACIVGDRLDTDIALGREGGLRTFLPLTGVTTLEDIHSADKSALPDYYMPCLATLTGSMLEI
mmetsp:Transcript_47792/g.121940  ORF Transcript_47792/g.121940 Transcript_47792/m.121940 type:complete len:374 (+) Transcript_47792:139-1260(+)|eukprot:jgi/Tetstr1/443873/TSEL_031826.t1